MEIKLTKEQYKNLIKLVYLGNWMVNAIRSGNKEDPQIEKYNEIEQYIFSFAKDFGLEKYVEYVEEFKEFFPTREFEDDPEIEKYINDYDEETFWEELIHRLSWRDFIRTYGKEAVEKMDIEERIEKGFPFEEKYRQEFAKNGLNNLEVLKRLEEIL